MSPASLFMAAMLGVVAGQVALAAAHGAWGAAVVGGAVAASLALGTLYTLRPIASASRWRHLASAALAAFSLTIVALGAALLTTGAAR